MNAVRQSVLALLAATISGSVVGQELMAASPSFGAGGVLPVAHQGAACGGGDVSPPVVWSAVPADARSLALWMTDDDTGARWVVYNLAVARRELRQGDAQRSDVDATVGVNGDGAAAYRGPCRRAAPARARVTVTVVATDLELQALPEGLTVEGLERRLKGHELDRAGFDATYER